MSDDLSRDADDPRRLPRPRRGRGRADVRIADGEVEDVEAAHLRAAALLRGVPARPRVHRGARHHRADLRHLPGRLPDERRAARWRTPAASTIDAGRSATCAGCSTAASGSRATRCTSTCSTRPTSSATRTRSRWPRDHRDVVEQGLRAEEGRQRDDGGRSAAGRSTRSTCASAASTARRPARSCARWSSRCECGRGDRARDGPLGRRASTFPTSSASTELVALAGSRRVPDRARADRLRRRPRHRTGASSTTHVVEEHVAALQRAARPASGSGAPT